MALLTWIGIGFCISQSALLSGSVLTGLAAFLFSTVIITLFPAGTKGIPKGSGEWK